MHPNTPTYYIAGYNSSGNTTRKLQAHIPQLLELTYDVLQPATSLAQMARQIQQTNALTITLIASSLGGWYAERLSAVIAEAVTDSVTDTAPNIHLHLILYNPPINAETNLAKYELPAAVLDEYTTLKNQCPSVFASHTRSVIVSIDDDVVSPHDSIAYYTDHCEHDTDRVELIQTTGGHRMTEGNLGLVVRTIEDKVICPRFDGHLLT